MMAQLAVRAVPKRGERVDNNTVDRQFAPHPRGYCYAVRHGQYPAGYRRDNRNRRLLAPGQYA